MHQRNKLINREWVYRRSCRCYIPPDLLGRFLKLDHPTPERVSVLLPKKATKRWDYLGPVNSVLKADHGHDLKAQNLFVVECSNRIVEKQSGGVSGLIRLMMTCVVFAGQTHVLRAKTHRKQSSMGATPRSSTNSARLSRVITPTNRPALQTYALSSLSSRKAMSTLDSSVVWVTL